MRPQRERFTWLFLAKTLCRLSVVSDGIGSHRLPAWPLTASTTPFDVPQVVSRTFEDGGVRETDTEPRIFTNDDRHCKSAYSTFASEVGQVCAGLLSLANKVLEIRISGEAGRDAPDGDVAAGEELSLHLL